MMCTLGNKVCVGSRFIGERHLSSFLPHDTGEEGNFLIEEESEEEYRPGFVRYQAVVVAWGRLFYPG